MMAARVPLSISLHPHLDSELVAPPVLVEGRWLLPEDENAIVITAFMRKDEPDIRLGDDIILKIGGRERSCRVVGVAVGTAASMIYANTIMSPK